ncbi:type IV pilus modification protein PilV [Halomonas sp. SH5A2]|uniref:type IV pilus modification protein PilV n=1 Tax=Halomonas sp. SH5A2 TaxID=2749040 RepID=UPI001641DC1F|nr:type IV pilus modification protein PilV [Halomonas sp. SH5A2]QNI04139.1 type IV pilus modification protein PilV [Halomonas sp. SH5A2]
MTQRGFSLVEALIALLVLSLGLVGVAAMQLKALQSASLGYQRSVASVAAVDAQERLWAQLATLEASQTCADINVDALEQAWANHWFQDNDHAPLRNAVDSSIENGNDSCQFTVTLALSDNENASFDYTFRLPEVP